MLLTEYGDQLSTTEMRILRGMAQGESDKQIAYTLCVTAATIGEYAWRIYVKLGARNRTHAVHLAHLWGLLRQPGLPAEEESVA